MNAITRSTHARSNDERRADWSYTYFRAGLHRDPIENCPVEEKPIRPIVQAMPSGARDHEQPANSPSLTGDRALDGSIHGGHCNCGDDAQRHWALVARDLMAQGREAELTDDMRQAYDYEFGGVREPEPIETPEL